MFKQVKINVLLIDVICQVPSYAHFLKDLCTIKRKMNWQKKDFLIDQVSATLQNKGTIKYKTLDMLSFVVGLETLRLIEQYLIWEHVLTYSHNCFRYPTSREWHQSSSNHPKEAFPSHLQCAY